MIHKVHSAPFLVLHLLSSCLLPATPGADDGFPAVALEREPEGHAGASVLTPGESRAAQGPP